MKSHNESTFLLIIKASLCKMTCNLLSFCLGETFIVRKNAPPRKFERRVQRTDVLPCFREIRDQFAESAHVSSRPQVLLGSSQSKIVMARKQTREVEETRRDHEKALKDAGIPWGVDDLMNATHEAVVSEENQSDGRSDRRGPGNPTYLSQQSENACFLGKKVSSDLIMSLGARQRYKRPASDRSRGHSDRAGSAETGICLTTGIPEGGHTPDRTGTLWVRAKYVVHIRTSSWASRWHTESSVLLLLLPLPRVRGQLSTCASNSSTWTMGTRATTPPASLSLSRQRRK